MADTTPLPRDQANGVPIQGTFRTVTDGARTTVANAGTAVQLSTSSIQCKMIIVQALFSNTSFIAVGASDVKATLSSEKGILLEAGATYTLPLFDVSLAWIDARVNGEGITFQYFV